MTTHRFSLTEAAVPLMIAAVIMGGMILSGSTALYIPLGIGAAVAALLALRRGYALRTLGSAALGGMKSTMIALTILLLVGGLIGVWKASGTVPAMVYYGLGLAQPSYLVPAAFLLSLAVSMMLGTSIGTLSTIGVALIGVAHGVGASLPLVAGALVSGALFGDRSSPLSGSLNLNVAMTGTDLRRMLSVLTPSGVTAAVLSLIAYAVAGAGAPVAQGAAGSAMRQAIAAQFVISPWLLVPPVLVLALAFLRIPVRWALGCGILAGGILAVVLQGAAWAEPFKVALFGFTSQTGSADLDRIFSGGGVLPMARQIALILTAGAFNGIMEQTGMMTVLIARLVEGVRRPLALVGSTMLVSVAVSMVAANQALAIIITGRMLRPAYDQAGLSPELLSRSVADSGTVIAGIIPWNIMGILAAAALGVSVRTFVPYVFWALLLPMISLVMTMLEERRGRLSVEVAVVKGE
ncbi:MAG TPA: Na+/H+ antiporter NhaC family protein [Symbiobacteriaceae bacterium]|nr:Na+/H+ antiporter NhaC family protein [Symbiobacteriaceae bacterium]